MDLYPGFIYGTYKLGTNGSTIWTNYFPQPPSGSSAASSIAVDSANNSYVTGYSPGTNSENDIVTIKYAANGNQIWLQRYNGPGNGNDAGNAIAVDNNGNVYVAGYDTAISGGTEMVLIKYSPVILQVLTNGTVLLQAQGSPGESFDIQASADLLNWLGLGSVLADTNGLVQFEDTNAANYPSRFYYTNPQ
jgi:outer membrane protein assembly factor BamB